MENEFQVAAKSHWESVVPDELKPVTAKLSFAECRLIDKFVVDAMALMAKAVAEATVEHVCQKHEDDIYVCYEEDSCFADIAKRAAERLFSSTK